MEEVQDAELVILRYLQLKCYSGELQSLGSGRGTVSKGSPLYKLEQFQDSEGLLRVKGRLQNSQLAHIVKHPVILPRDHHVTELIVRQVHEWDSGHSGREHVLSTLRQKYWIPRAQPLLNKVLRNCVVCKKLRGKQEIQMMADLPSERVTPHKPPFTYTGVDCFGPFFVKRGRSREKRYGCLFTCMAIRAVHIEKLHSLDEVYC